MSKNEDELRDYLPLIGRLAVDSARLEWGLAGLYALLRPNTGFSDGFRFPHDRLVKEIKRDLRAYVPDDDALGAQVVYWAKEASTMLTTRGDIMHSNWVVSSNSATELPEVYRTHLRTQTQVRHTLAELQALVERQHQHMKTYPVAWTLAHLIAVGAGVLRDADAVASSADGQEEPPTR